MESFVTPMNCRKIFRLKMECREIIPEILGLSQYGQE
jgi:hypothetical protein